MPEGPEIRRAADIVAAAIEGKTAIEVSFGLPELQPWGARLSGQKISRIETRGKAMLTRFGNGYTIYSHNQLYGRWLCVPAGEWPQTNRSLRLAIKTDDQWALLYSASDIEVLENDKVAAHPFVSRLGPDVLDGTTTTTLIEERLLGRRYRNRRLGNFLTDQQFAAGLGNYLRCEILFTTRLSPARKPAELSEQEITSLAAAILELPRQSYSTEGITNRLDRAHQLMDAGSSFEDARFQVFRRAGKPCYRCGEAIIKAQSGGQACYFCPTCQQIT